MEKKTIEIAPIGEMLFLPKKQTISSAGFDLYTPVDVKIEPGKQICIPLGFKMILPTNCYAELRERSSVALKMVRTSAGIIDSDYRNEVILILHNYGSNVFESSKGDRLAQMIIHPYSEDYIIQMRFNLTQKTERLGGFGSTGD